MGLTYGNLGICAKIVLKYRFSANPVSLVAVCRLTYMDKLPTMQARKTLLGSLLHAAWERMKETLPEDMTGNMKTQYLGIYSAIIILHESGETPTATSLSEFTGTSYPTISKITRELVRMGIVGRHQILASHGKGIQYSFEPLYELRNLRREPEIPVDAPTAEPTRRRRKKP